MATGRSSFAKRQRDMAKKAKAQTKREKKLEDNDDEGVDDAVEEAPTLPNAIVMERVADLHRRYDDGQMDLDTFDEERANLMAQISVD